jgi:hypothetical protein
LCRRVLRIDLFPKRYIGFEDFIMGKQTVFGPYRTAYYHYTQQQ